MRGRIGLLLALLLTIAALPAGAARAESPGTGAGGAILIEAATGRVLLEENADNRLPMASTTKVMTALVAIEHTADLDALIQIPDGAVGVEGSSMYLNRGESLSMRDLLYGLMLTSGNDAAVAIAMTVGGSVEGFAELMNQRARELGCENTNFVTPNGLHDDQHYTTARDLAAISAEAMKNPTFREVVGTTYHETTTGDRKRTLKNKNKTLWQYEGGCGIKTGYTKKAGKCLVFSAQREQTVLIGVVLRAGDMWGNAFSMLDRGFDLVETQTLLKGGQQVALLPVAGGRKKELAIFAKDDILYPLRKDGSDTFTLAVNLPEGLAAPVEAGKTVGSVTLYVNGEDTLTTALVTGKSVPKDRWMDWMKELVHWMQA